MAADHRPVLAGVASVGRADAGRERVGIELIVERWRPPTDAMWAVVMLCPRCKSYVWKEHWLDKFECLACGWKES